MLIRYIAAIIRVLPDYLARTLARLLADFWYWLIPVRKDVMDLNIGLAFPDLPRGRRKRLVRRTMLSFTRTLVEFARLNRVTPEFVQQRVTMDGLEIVQRALKKDKGVIIISGHMGNWELMGAACRRHDLPISYIVKRVKDQAVDDLINGWRRELNIEIIYAKESNVAIMEHLRRNRLVAFMVDQDAGRRGVQTTFFGHPASTPKGAAVYAYKSGAPVVLALGLRERGRRYRILFREVSLPFVEEVSESAIQTAMQIMTDHVENAVRDYPDQYMWMHHRWRTWLKEQGRI